MTIFEEASFCRGEISTVLTHLFICMPAFFAAFPFRFIPVKFHISAMLLSFSVTEGNNDSGHESWEATLNEGLQATKIADNALSALSPIDDEDDHTNNVDGYDEQINNTEQKGVKDIEDDEELLI